ncbi:MAG: hypothetical protein JWO80_5355, partial [Bryobacterales bacterium]|nr:hypothetical protein [Bryobacterales bacterium]
SVLWLASAGLLAFSSDPLLLGRQDSDATTLTNRIPLWQECLRFFKERPILGYGFGAFWTPDTTSDVSVPPEMAWFPLSERKIADNLYVDAAHNTYLEMALGTGLVGASLFVMSMATGIRAYAVRAAARSSALSAYGFSVLVAVALNMMLEALTFQPYMPLLMCPILLIRMGVVTEPADESRIRTWDREDARV